MSTSQARRVISLFAIVLGFSVGLLVGPGQAEAEPLGADFSSTFQTASLGSFETHPQVHSDSRLAEPFGLGTSALRSGGLAHKWRVVEKQLRHDRKILARCRENIETCPLAAKRFLAVVDKGLTREGVMRIAEINRAVNLNIRPVDDLTQNGVPDQWASPLTAFASMAGDCEDYAIAKYAALREIGVAAEDLRLVVVHDRAANDHHAVTAVRAHGRWLILDNRTLDLRPDVEIAQFDPLFILGGRGVKPVAAGKPKLDEAPPRFPLPAGLAQTASVLSHSARSMTPFLL